MQPFKFFLLLPDALIEAAVQVQLSTVDKTGVLAMEVNVLPCMAYFLGAHHFVCVRPARHDGNRREYGSVAPNFSEHYTAVRSHGRHVHGH